MNAEWIDEAVAKLLADARAVGMSPSEVARRMHAGEVSLDSMPRAVGTAVTVLILERYLPDEIREAERIERERSQAEARLQATRVLQAISEVIHEWQALPDDTRLQAAPEARESIYDLVRCSKPSNT